MAIHLAERGPLPELVLCSPARRTLDTLAPLRKELDPRVRVRVERALYLAGAAHLLARLRRLPARERTVLLVGHDPGIHELAVALAGSGAARARARLREKFPTGALAVFTLPGSWRDLAPGAARLVEFTRPRDLD
jgi:phosphohistidine phosphatase